MTDLKARRSKKKTSVLGFDQYIGAVLLRERIKYGWTKSKLARLVGVSPQQIGKYEQGVDSVRTNALLVICEQLGLDFTALIKEAAAQPGEGIQLPKGPKCHRQLMPQELLAFKRKLTALVTDKHIDGSLKKHKTK